MRSKLGDKNRLKHIIDAILEIEKYVVDTDFNKFSENSMMRFACIKQMEIIGEASNHVSEEIKVKFSSIEWQQIIGMRNIFVHEYFGIDDNILWQIIMNDIPNLKIKILQILKELET